MNESMTIDSMEKRVSDIRSSEALELRWDVDAVHGILRQAVYILIPAE